MERIKRITGFNPPSAIRHPPFFFRPGMVTAILAVLLIAAVVLFRMPGPSSVSAAELLHRSVEAEQAVASRTDSVLHRTILLEERPVELSSIRHPPSAIRHQVVSRRRIEIWHSGGQKVKARRVYDEKHQLIAGEWVRPDGTRLIYGEQGSGIGDQRSRKRHQRLVQEPASTIRNPQSAIRHQEVWQLDLSAKDFTSLVGRVEEATVEEKPDAYVLTYQNQRPATSDQRPVLLKVTLRLSNADLSATELTLLVRHDEIRDQGPGTRDQGPLKEYRFRETSLERRAASAVPPAMFEPDPEIMRMGEWEDGRMGADLSPTPPLPHSPTRFPVASTALEMDVLRRLNHVGALLGEQISLSRTTEGALLLQGIVETDKRKAEILQALGPVAKDPAITLDIATVEEATERQVAPASGPVMLDTVQVRQRAIPAEADLRAFFSAETRLSQEQLERDIQRFANRMLDRSRRARRHALALKQIVERFSSEELSALDEASRKQWLSMLRQHAQAVQQETAALRQELHPIFGSLRLPDEGNEETSIAGTPDLVRAIQRLFEVASNMDEAVSRSFSIYVDKAGGAPVKSSSFWRGLRIVESLSQRVLAVSKE